MLDVIVIGGGVTGVSIARSLARYHLSLLLIESLPDLAMGQTAHCVGLVRSAVHTTPGTLSGVLVAESTPLWVRQLQDLHMPFRRDPSLLLAQNAHEWELLEQRFRSGEANGEKGLKKLCARALYAREPLLARGLRGALFDPNALVVDPVSYTLALAQNAVENGLALALGESVVNLRKRAQTVTVTTEKDGESKTYRTRYLVNAAGLDARTIKGLISPPPNQSRHRKSQYLLLNAGATPYGLAHSLERIGERGEQGFGVHTTALGDLILGPLETTPTHRHDLAPELANLHEILQRAHRLLLRLPEHHVANSFAGISEESEDTDFQIHFEPTCPLILNVLGLPHLGFSASPGIAEYVTGLLQGAGLELPLKESFSCRRHLVHPTDSHHLISHDLLREVGDPLRVVCSCSYVREGDILNHLKEPIPLSVEAVHRRLGTYRVTCRLGHCNAFIRKILSEYHNLAYPDIKERDSPVIKDHPTPEELRSGLIGESVDLP